MLFFFSGHVAAALPTGEPEMFSSPSHSVDSIDPPRSILSTVFLHVRNPLITPYIRKLQAAIRAGYSRKTAQEQSSRLLSNVMVAAAIEKGMATRSRLDAGEFSMGPGWRDVKATEHEENRHLPHGAARRSARSATPPSPHIFASSNPCRGAK